MWVCPHACMCMLTHICLNVSWRNGRLKLHDGGGDTIWWVFPWSYSYIFFLFLVEWPNAISSRTPRKTAQERSKMQRDSNCTTKWNEKSERCRENEEWSQRGEERMGTWQEKKKMIQECSLINASPPVNESKKAPWCCSAFSERRTRTHILRLDEHFTLSLTKQTSKSCSFAIHWLSRVPLQRPANKQFTASRSFVAVVIFCWCLLAHLLMSKVCQGEDVGWMRGYPWAYHVKQYKFISYSSEWLFSAGGSWRYLSNSPFSLWFGSFEQCGPRQLVRTATSVTLPPGLRGGGGGGRWGRWQRWKGCSEGCWGGCGMIG